MSLTAIIITAFGIIWSIFLAPLIVKLLKKYNIQISDQEMEALKNLIIEAIRYVEQISANTAKKGEPKIPSSTKKVMAVDYVVRNLDSNPVLKRFKNLENIKDIISDKIEALLKWNA